MSTTRSDFGLVSLDSKLYAMGGYNSKARDNSVETYDTQTNTWKSVSSMNILRNEFDSAVISNTIYVCGGGNDKYFKSCEYYSLNINKWHLTTPMNVERCGLGLVSHEGFLYAIGGRNGNGYLNSMEMFDTKTKRWIPKGNMEYQRVFFGSVSFTGKIYVCGGYSNTDEKTCETYDPKTNQWTPIASMKTIRSSFKLIAFDENLYALGGYSYTDNVYIDSVEVYDRYSNEWYYTTLLPKKMKSFRIFNSCEYYSPNIDKWQSTTAMNVERYGLGLVSINEGFLYAIGGRNINGFMNSMEMFDTKTKQWIPKTNMVYQRQNFGSLSFMGKIYVCGGRGGNNDETSCETYDPQTNQWQPIASMKTRRSYFKLIAFDDKLYALGGYSTIVNQYIDSVELYDHNSNQWSYTTSLPQKMRSFGV
ncbi:kelch-like protein 17 [Oppia nitens]|uniref:kelch-like protein 17 n=1 Tax=Oppia nitens TaxID=1686743 RepID=UPI0023DA814F|nr:kelch-like protein 17 [Oppia nitens]